MQHPMVSSAFHLSSLAGFRENFPFQIEALKQEKKMFLPFFLLVWKVTPLALCNISLRRYFPKFRNTFDTKFRDMTS